MPKINDALDINKKNTITIKHPHNGLAWYIWSVVWVRSTNNKLVQEGERESYDHRKNHKKNFNLLLHSPLFVRNKQAFEILSSAKKYFTYSSSSSSSHTHVHHYFLRISLCIVVPELCLLSSFYTQSFLLSFWFTFYFLF